MDLFLFLSPTSSNTARGTRLVLHNTLGSFPSAGLVSGDVGVQLLLLFSYLGRERRLVCSIRLSKLNNTWSNFN